MATFFDSGILGAVLMLAFGLVCIVFGLNKSKINSTIVTTAIIVVGGILMLAGIKLAFDVYGAYIDTMLFNTDNLFSLN